MYRKPLIEIPVPESSEKFRLETILWNSSLRNPDLETLNLENICHET